ncbi:TVP38/TMEM64 family protein [Clostridium fallax]|uniref:TVP38/TMEM64 family membrane protein n=1 Tax=Clostridium fallax TaxID=1533 RepID=A0A1M4VBD9_9CLOT|nr:TVP38/TMEM64 family protein [Clostridium fallax]SHE66285.1 Uncharacterized membrane protein YdjX, TVP38/TMEM64 family, SNARE-associated domain [Clostridium fallax]SQB05799.1 membrane spanning protein [Clostridium fallax]
MKKKSVYLKLTIFVGIIVIGIIGFFILKKNLKEFSIDSIANFIQEKGKYAALFFVICYALKPFVVVFPSAVVSLAGGVMFGPFNGFILNMVGFFLSGTIAFWIARKLGRGFVETIVRGKMIKLDENMDKKGFKILFLLRLPPVLPYDPLSYTCGLTSIKYTDFILASLLGVVPETLCYSIIGKNILNPFSPQFILPAIFIIVATLSSGYIFKKRHSV